MNPIIINGAKNYCRGNNECIILNGIIPELSLLNKTQEELVIDVVGVKKDKHYTLPSFEQDIDVIGIEVNMQMLGINDKIKMIIKNRTGEILSIPKLKFSIQQIS